MRAIEEQPPYQQPSVEEIDSGGEPIKAAPIVSAE
jgi:hypothetical protein